MKRISPPSRPTRPGAAAAWVNGFYCVYWVQTRATEVRLVTLEVREHNAPAQALYKKLGFQQVGIRKGYYHDTGEDALLLTLFYLDNEAVWRFLQQVRAAIEEEGVTR